MKQLTVVIVNYNSCRELERCLASIAEQTELTDIQVVVVDNASPLGDPRDLAGHFPWAHFVFNPENVGFARACNRGLTLHPAKYYLLLNPDTEIRDRAIEKCVQFLGSKPEAGLLGCKVLNPDGTLQRASRRSIPNLTNSLFQLLGISRWFKGGSKSGYNRTDLPADQTHEVEAVSGSFLMFRQALLEQTKGLDERFFMYGEDLDFCLQSLQNGWTNFFFAGASVVHHKGSSSQTDLQRSTFHFYDAMKLFYDKHYGKKQNRLAVFLVHRVIDSLYLVKRIRQRLSPTPQAGSRG